MDGAAEALVLRRTEDGVATLTLNLPERLNPIALPLQQQLLGHVRSLHDDRDVRALVLTGAGRGFCAGADLQTMQGRESGGKSLGELTGEWMTTLTNPLVLALRSLPMPTLAAVNGVAAGGGVGLALACDVVVAARSASFYLPFLPKLGIVPDVGSTWMLPRLVGRARAVGLALLGDRISADQAADWGLIWGAFDDDEFGSQVRALASRLAALPSHAALEARRAFEASEANSLAAQLGYEASRQGELIDGEAFAEGVRAFLGKRAPEFHGR